MSAYLNIIQATRDTYQYICFGLQILSYHFRNAQTATSFELSRAGVITSEVLLRLTLYQRKRGLLLVLVLLSIVWFPESVKRAFRLRMFDWHHSFFTSRASERRLARRREDQPKHED